MCNSASPGGPTVKNLPAKPQKMQVQSLGWEGPLEKGMATHSSIFFFFPSILEWRSPWTEEPSKLQSTGSQRLKSD